MGTFDEFIKDWKISKERKSAKHVSGLNIEVDTVNEDGSLRLALSGMSSFMKNTYAELKDVDATNRRLHELEQQFVEIYKKMFNGNG